MRTFVNALPQTQLADYYPEINTLFDKIISENGYFYSPSYKTYEGNSSGYHIKEGPLCGEYIWLDKWKLLSKLNHHEAALDLIEDSKEYRNNNSIYIDDFEPEIIDGQLFLYKAISLEKTGDYEESLKIYEYLLLKDPEDAYLWERKAEITEKLGMIKDAINAYNNLLAISPSYEIQQRRDSLVIKSKNNNLDQSDPLALLKIKFAKGEISEDVYVTKKRLLTL